MGRVLLCSSTREGPAIHPKGTTVQNPQDFPRCLYIDPVEGESEGPAGARRRFNACVWQFDYRPAQLTRTERGWLSAALGINVLIGSWSVDAADDYLAADEVTSMLDSLHVLLNYDLGRLDAYRGRLSEWVAATKLRIHIHPDTGEHITDEARAAYELEWAS